MVTRTRATGGGVSVLRALSVVMVLCGIGVLGAVSADRFQRTPASIDAEIAAPPQIMELAPASDDFTDKKSDAAATEGDRFWSHGNLFESSQSFVGEVEDNGTSATANALGGTNVVAHGHIFPVADLDFWSIQVTGGDRVYAATMSAFAASSTSGDTVIDLYDSDGTTLIETDLDDGSFGSTASSIAGAVVPGAGAKTVYLRVKNNSATARTLPYHLHVRVQSGSPATEVEVNDTTGTATALPASGWISGTRGTTTDVDYFSFTVNAGDTAYLSLDANPERDAIPAAGGWDARLGVFGTFGDLGNLILVVNDTSTGSATNPRSEAMFMTFQTGGTYYAYVDSTVASGDATYTYQLSVSIHPATDEGVNCTTYSSSDVPKTIPAAGGVVSSTISVPGNPTIADLDVSIELNHLQMADIDAHLRSPAANDNGLFSDVGSATAGTAAQTLMNLTLDDEAGIPIGTFTPMRSFVVQPELNYRLGWFDGEKAGGTWTLDLYDDTNNTSGGTLTNWSLRICERPASPSACVGGNRVTVFSTNFEAGASGFTHSGTADEWALGTPSGLSAPILTCNSGTQCFKTDLTGGYNASCNQDLLSPNISLAGYAAPVTVTWAQRYQSESANYDRGLVEIRQVGGATPRTLWEFYDSTMSETVGLAGATIHESAGWAGYERDISSYLGQNVELRFNMVSDTSLQFSGYAVDDVQVTAGCTGNAQCDDANVCTDDTCVSGCCVHTNNTNACTDGNPCTSPDVCSGGVCVPGTNPCNDNNICTNDICDGGGGCTYVPVSCDDSNPCTNDSCDTVLGCQHANNTNVCSDGNACTLGDVCAGGTCVPGPLPPSVQFCNNGGITIPDTGTATPYPSTISVTRTLHVAVRPDGRPQRNHAHLPRRHRHPARGAGGDAGEVDPHVGRGRR